MSWSPDGHPCTRARAVAIVCGLLLAAGAARAAQIKNVTVAPRDAATATVRFDISWANSWRHEANHDAAWVFFKVRPEGGTQWQHVRLVADKVLNPTGYGHGEGTPVDLIVPDGRDGFVGMFVRRAEYGVGTVKATKITAVWDFRANKGITKDTKVRVQAFGIEMVYVSEGPFDLGSGGTEPFRFYRYTDGTQHRLPYRVTSAGAIPTGRQEGKLWARGYEPEDGGEIPAAFPNGYAAIYCMKYHISKGQYAGFLSTLNPEQAQVRYVAKSGITRSGESPNYTYSSGFPYRSCGGLSWADGVAFGAWAGLRPMTELEFEKVSRGPMEAGWDTGDRLDHPSYWAVQSWCGWRVFPERVVTVANARGRDFKGTHGLGKTDVPADWPLADAVGATGRGGHGPHGRWSCRKAPLRTDQRNKGHGWRGVRTAPKEVGL